MKSVDYKKVFYAIPDFQENIVNLYTEDMKELESIVIDENIPEVVKVGIICSCVANGGSLLEVCNKEESWAMPQAKFYSLLDLNEKYKNMFKRAKSFRLHSLEEEIVNKSGNFDSKEDEASFKSKVLVLKSLREAEKIEQEKGKEKKSVIMVSWFKNNIFKKNKKE